MENIEKLNELKNMCSNGKNIIEYLTEGHRRPTTAEDEMISYDLRAGKDIEDYKKDDNLTNRVVRRIVSFFEDIGCLSGSVLECGSGEGIKLVSLLNQKQVGFSWAGGVDISWSRVKKAQQFSEEYLTSDVNINFFVGDIFQLPLKTSSVDIVYTMQGIYGFGGRERECMKELYRVAAKYLVLIEPSYELANEDARKRMISLGYVRNLLQTAEELHYKIIKYELFGEDVNPLNPAAVLIIEKGENVNCLNPLCCPVTQMDVRRIGNAYFCDKSLLSYPILNGVPCMTKENAIVTAKMGE